MARRLPPATLERLRALRQRDPLERAEEYIEGVTSGAIPACRHVRNAVKRHLRDLKRDKWTFDENEARRACAFVESMPHVKGELAGHPLTLEPWQCWVVSMIFGWFDPETDLRRFQTVYLELPRKNAKTTLGAAIGLYMFLADSEMGAECYTAASKLDQAAICFSMARQMVIRNPALKRTFGISVAGGATYAGSLYLQDASIFKPLPKDLSGSLDGLSPSFALLDEVHSYPTNDVYDALDLGMGARAQPLLFGITTAGFGLGGVGHMHSKRAADMLDGKIELDTHFACIWTIDDDDEWSEEAAWRKANPNFGVSVRPAHMARLCQQARVSPESLRGFLTKNLNVWMGADSTWLNIADYDKCTAELKWEDFEGCPCWPAFDLSERDDLTAVAYWFLKDARLYLKVRSYAPRIKIETNPQYRAWHAAELLEACDGQNGAAIDAGDVFDQLAEDKARFDVQYVGYDDWHAADLANRIQDMLDISPIKVAQSARAMSRPMREFAAAVSDRSITIEDNPALRWMVGNVVALRDTLGRARPGRNDSGDKIDAAVAALMGFAIASADAARFLER